MPEFKNHVNYAVSADPEVTQVVKLGYDSAKVADAVSVGILEAFHVDFIGDGFLPLGVGFCLGKSAARCADQNKNQKQRDQIQLFVFHIKSPFCFGYRRAEE